MIRSSVTRILDKHNLFYTEKIFDINNFFVIILESVNSQVEKKINTNFHRLHFAMYFAVKQIHFIVQLFEGILTILK